MKTFWRIRGRDTLYMGALLLLTSLITGCVIKVHYPPALISGCGTGTPYTVSGSLFGPPMTDCKLLITRFNSLPPSYKTNCYSHTKDDMYCPYQHPELHK